MSKPQASPRSGPAKFGPAKSKSLGSGPLSNAERQRRWRERLKAKAAGAAVADHARDVVARAIGALWAYHERPGPGGMRWAAIDGCHTIEDFKRDLAADERGLIAAARAFVPGFDGLTSAEARAIAALVELDDVVTLREPPEPSAPPPDDAGDQAIKPTAARHARRRGQTQRTK